MSLAGHNRETLDFLRRYWGGMLAEGATSWWEGYDPTWEKTDFHAHLQADNGTGYFVSLSHGWSSGPTSWLTERVLGVRPTSGGFQTAEIVPDLGGLAWAEGDVPTPQGAIQLHVETKGGETTVRVTMPKGVDALIGVPGDLLMENGKLLKSVHTEADRQWTHLDRPGVYLLKCAL
jgi:alpha-L-rhamnosidase